MEKLSRRAAHGSSVTVLRDLDPFAPDRPMAVQIEFTSRCNLRCRMCPLTTGTSSSSGEPGPMRAVVFDELVQIARHCGRVVIAGYGEPLTNPQCLPMLRALDAAGVEIAIATNGIALTPRTARELAVLGHLTHIGVSIDSPDPVIYRELRGGSVRRALQGLRNLMVVIDNPDRVVVASVAFRVNLASLVGFPELLAEVGVRRFSLQAAIDYNDYARDQSLLDHAEIAGLLEEIETACVAHGVRLELSAPDRSRADLLDAEHARERFYGLGEWDETRTRQCHVPWQVPFVDKDGRVFACCFAASADERQLGQLGTESFDAIWTGAAFRQFRSDIVDGATTPEICRRCTVAPLGEHPFKTWVASIESASIKSSRWSTAAVSVSVRNLGVRAWTAADQIRVGTSAPRDAGSPLAHPGWASPNRPVTLTDSVVPPGGLTTLEFPVIAPGRKVATQFELVADGSSWIPNTRFVVAVGDRRPAAAVYVFQTRRRFGARPA